VAVRFSPNPAVWAENGFMLQVTREIWRSTDHARVIDQMARSLWPHPPSWQTSASRVGVRISPVRVLSTIEYHGRTLRAHAV
jgi:hypothetical protein